MQALPPFEPCPLLLPTPRLLHCARDRPPAPPSEPAATASRQQPQFQRQDGASALPPGWRGGGAALGGRSASEGDDQQPDALCRASWQARRCPSCLLKAHGCDWQQRAGRRAAVRHVLASLRPLPSLAPPPPPVLERRLASSTIQRPPASAAASRRPPAARRLRLVHPSAATDAEH